MRACDSLKEFIFGREGVPCLGKRTLRGGVRGEKAVPL